MDVGRSRGFTIIEVMLALAIGGLLLGGFFVGSSAAISTQRYSDSVYSLQAEIQAQYSEAENVYSSCRGGSGCATNVTCAKSGSSVSITPVAAGASTPRGQTDCVILGRYITTTSNPSTLLVRGVVGVQTSTISSSDDIADLQQHYQIAALGNTDTAQNKSLLALLKGESYRTEWGQALKKQGGANATYGILILRSPQSGDLYTLITTTPSMSPETLLHDNAATGLATSATLCVDTNASGVSSRSTMAIKIAANAANPSGVQVIGNAAVRSGSLC